MNIIEHLTHNEKGKMKLLIHNVLESTELYITISNLINKQRKRLKLEPEVVNKFNVKMELEIRNNQYKKKSETYLM